MEAVVPLLAFSLVIIAIGSVVIQTSFRQTIWTNRRSMQSKDKVIAEQSELIERQIKVMENQQALLEQALEDVTRSNAVAKRALDERDRVLRMMESRAVH